MDRLLIKGPSQLKGDVSISASKNSSLPIMTTTLLTGETVSLPNLPHLSDIQTMKKLLQQLGTIVEIGNDGVTHLRTPSITSHTAPYDLVRTMRASILVLGPLLARYGEAIVSLPGGCAIGTRPIDIHLAGLKKMGAEIELAEGYVRAKTKKLKGSKIVLPFPSVGATENLLCAASLAQGTTLIENSAQEPEIEDLANLLNQMGAKISGAGSHEIEIEGVEELRGTQYQVMPDRVEAATYIIAALITNSSIKVKSVRPEHLESFLEVITSMGANLIIGEQEIEILQHEKLKGMKVDTAPYPGLPTDMQAQLMALATQCSSNSIISEHIFENRFMHVPELNRLGAKIDLHGNSAVVEVNGPLTAAPVMCTDLRASAALVLAALVAHGTTEIRRVYHLDRGYANMDRKLKELGVDIKRLT